MWKRDKLIRHDDYEIPVNGVNIVIRDNVFTPDESITNSSSILLRNMPDVKDKEILDIGCGTWIIWVAAWINGARNITCSDVNWLALKNTLENFERYDIQDKLVTIQSNLFDSISWKFDYIFANLPILDEIRNWSPEFNNSTNTLIQEFLSDFRSYLKEWWKWYLTRASFADIWPLKKFLKEKEINSIEIRENKDWFIRSLFELL